ncbi:MAG: dihydrofolate reductase [Bdellovibrio sp.]|nr:dihydrofolate reductase [Bdellovibrio sp.]
MLFSIITAIGKHNQIGKDNRLLWHIPEDLKLFRKLTMGHHLMMGRKTFHSIGRPLPGRKMLVLSQKEKMTKLFPQDSAANIHAFANSLDAMSYARHNNVQELFVYGGGQIYTMMLPLAHRLYISHVDYDGVADTFFPSVDFSEYSILEEQAYPTQGLSPGFLYRLYEKRSEK